jgi:hypothetical protein
MAAGLAEQVPVHEKGAGIAARPERIALVWI